MYREHVSPVRQRLPRRYSWKKPMPSLATSWIMSTGRASDARRGAARAGGAG